MEKKFRKNILMALGTSGALLALGATAAWWRARSGDGAGKDDVDAGLEPKAGAEPTTESSAGVKPTTESSRPTTVNAA